MADKNSGEQVQAHQSSTEKDKINEKLMDCHDCKAKPGETHKEGCDTERCSVCGEQRLCCGCKGHDKGFARWTGLWPGKAESEHLGIDLNKFEELIKIFFVKPEEKEKETIDEIDDGENRGFQQKTLYSIVKSRNQDFDWDVRQQIRRGPHGTITLFSLTEDHRKRLIKLLSSIEKRRE